MSAGRASKLGPVWPLQDAKNRLSEVVDRALQEGPQIISRRGAKVVAVIAYEQFRRDTRHEVPLTRFLMQSPLKGVDLDLSRDRDAGRDVEL
jgi:prevent-host-death family protein